MNEPQAKTYADYLLPPSVVSKLDVSHLVTEMERIDNELTAAAVRVKAGAETENVSPTLSEPMADFLKLNTIQLASGLERASFIAQLRLLKDKVPIMHMTFAVEADRDSLAQLVQWLRDSVHPQTVISVGLQPALVAGVYLRTPNQVRDLSLRAMLDGRHDLLVQDLEAIRGRS